MEVFLPRHGLLAGLSSFVCYKEQQFVYRLCSCAVFFELQLFFVLSNISALANELKQERKHMLSSNMSIVFMFISNYHVNYWMTLSQNQRMLSSWWYGRILQTPTNTK